MLGVGHVTESKDGIWSFRIRDIKQLKNIIFPIFDAFMLISVKYFDYFIVKEAYDILTSDLSKTEINSKMEELYLLLKRGPEANYVSPVWNSVDLRVNQMTRGEVVNIISKHWLIGFMEAEGSFDIIQKDSDRYAHGMGITQKCDRQILEAIRLIFNSKAQVKFRNPQNYNSTFYGWDTTSQSCCELIIDYFDGHFIGRTSLKFAVWKKSLYYKGDDLIAARDKLRKLSV